MVKQVSGAVLSLAGRPAPLSYRHLIIAAQELDICQLEAAEGKDAVIFKQVGPVLIKNDLSEAKDTVEKRLEFITGELKKTESFIQTKETQAQELAQKIQEMQMAMQRAAVEAAKVAAAQQQQTA